MSATSGRICKNTHSEQLSTRSSALNLKNSFWVVHRTSGSKTQPLYISFWHGASEKLQLFCNSLNWEFQFIWNNSKVNCWQRNFPMDGWGNSQADSSNSDTNTSYRWHSRKLFNNLYYEKNFIKECIKLFLHVVLSSRWYK